MKKALLFVLALILFISKSDAQWQTVPEFKALNSTSICSYGSNIFFCSDTAVYVSTNSGQSWTQTASEFGGTRVNKVYFYPQDNSLYAATDAGLYVSTNNGAAWKKLNSIACDAVCRYESSIYISYCDSYICYSMYNGLSWKRAPNGWPEVYSLGIFGDTLYCSTMESKLLKLKVNEDRWTTVQGVGDGTFGELLSDGESFYFMTYSKGWSKLSKDTYEWETISAPTGMHFITGILKYGKYYITSAFGDGIMVSDGPKFDTVNSGLKSLSIYGICMVGDNVFTCTSYGVYYANINDLISLTATEGDGPRPGSSFYPNPTNDVLNMRAEAGARLRVVVSDLLGNVVRSSEFESCRSELKISLSGLAAGSYCVTVYSNDRFIRTEIITKI